MIVPGVQPFMHLSVYSGGKVWTAPSFNPSNAADQVLRHSSVSWRQWRTMASFASRSAGIRKFDGLLVVASELCAIVRASYLSPSFPFLLYFESWQYLRRQLPKRNPSRSVAPDLKHRRFSIAPASGSSSCFCHNPDAAGRRMGTRSSGTRTFACACYFRSSTGERLCTTGRNDQR